jgi:hypothetical protein
MGGRRLPVGTLKLRGTFAHDPKKFKAREAEPVVTQPLIDPPATFSESELEAWHDIVRTAPVGVLTIADSIAVESMARLLARERAQKASDPQGRRLDALLAKFGMTPADRTRVAVTMPAKRPENPFSKTA